MLLPVVRFAIETGMRMGEILSLEWRNVDLTQRVATLPDTKTGDARQVPLSTAAIAAISPLPRHIKDGRVFWKWKRADSLENTWRRAVKSAGIIDLRFHDLRHEAVSRFFELGLNPMEVASISGHKTLQMLKRYRREDTRSTSSRASNEVQTLWNRCIPADETHPYISIKCGMREGLRVVPPDDDQTIAGQSVGGWLVVPVQSLDGELRTLQLIPPPGQGKKRNMPVAKMLDGMFIVGDLAESSRAFIVEGLATGWACWQATGSAAVVCFGAGRMAHVAELLRTFYAKLAIVVVPDRGKEAQAASIARAVHGQWAELPADEPKNYDANDYARDHGADALAELLDKPKAPATTLSVEFADELPETFTPPDEVVEGVLTTGDSSVIYGDSNSGKTFLAIDMACAVARGVPWMGRHTEPGLVVYLAAESPASVRRRLQAYQTHHGVKVPNFAIVQSPIDLFDGDDDTEKIIQVVHQCEAQSGQPARLLVGDTLARLSAGANENAGQDMGLVIRRIDQIRTECRTHFSLIHHSGKNAAAGSRGWSGVKAAVDTEMEVTDSPTGRCCEITKQRDLSTKGERIGFRLDTVTLGLTKWGAPATSCVVVPADAPAKQTGKRISEVGGAITEMLQTKSSGMKKRDVVQHFDGRYDKSAVYRELKRLVETGQVHECAGIVAILTSGGAKGAN
jgi:putative DNA primase/helicase